MDYSTKNDFTWSEGTLSESYPTNVPPENHIETIIIVAVSVVLTIGLLFALAVFIDCRHQKLIESGKPTTNRKLFSINIPKFFKFRRFSNEEDSFVDKMYEDGNTAA